MSEVQGITAPAQGTANSLQTVCKTCGASIYAAAEICPKCGVRQRTPISKAGLLLLTFFLGGIGAHKFYTGRNWQGALYLIFCWTYIPALIALIEFIIYAFTSSERLNEKYTAKGSAAVIIIAAVLAFIFIVGILAAIALPAYQDYTKRAKASEGMAMASNLKSTIADAFNQRPQNMSCNAARCDIGKIDLGNTRYVKQIYSIRTGVIIIEYDDQLYKSPQNKLSITPLIAGKVADLSDPANAGRSLSWKCGQDPLTTMLPKNLPSSCR